jgi:hypothetical protein
MHAQSLQTMVPPEVRRLACWRDPLSSLPKPAERVLNVASVPNTRPAGNPGPPQHSRQGGMDFLHQLVMG